MTKRPPHPLTPPLTDSTALTVRPVSGSALPVASALPDAVVEELRNHLKGSRAAKTFAAYESDWTSWERWCGELSQSTLPAKPEAVAAYLSALAKDGKALATLRRHLSTISRRHTLAGFQRENNPARAVVVKVVLDSVARKVGTEQDAKAPLALAELERILASIPKTIGGVRDRALLLVCFHGAFRASEAAQLTVADLRWDERGVVVLVRRSKTDQLGKGIRKALAFTNDACCAPTALKAWLKQANITTGPVFRPINRHGQILDRHFTGTVVSNVVKEYVTAAGLDSHRFASHSLRAGYVTQSLEDGVSLIDIANQTGHKNLEMVRRYDRRRARDPFAGIHTPKTKPTKETK